MQQMLSSSNCRRHHNRMMGGLQHTCSKQMLSNRMGGLQHTCSKPIVCKRVWIHQKGCITPNVQTTPLPSIQTPIQMQQTEYMCSKPRASLHASGMACTMQSVRTTKGMRL
jgi:hypothetical protein